MEQANLDWGKLPFGYIKTDYNLRVRYKDGKWGEVEVLEDDNISLPISATCLHYGQECFEGLKAFRGADGLVRIFRLEENAKRLNFSARGLCMQQVPYEIFSKMCHEVVKLNARFIPPYGTGASLYLRPSLIGVSASVGVKPAEEYIFGIFCTPVGPYFPGGFNPVRVQIVRDFDRAAPMGTGVYKVGGNYAASLQALVRAKAEGYSTSLFLDSKEKKYIDEAGPANFFGIKKNEHNDSYQYITPRSNSILRSITNMSIRDLASDMGLVVVERPVLVEELNDFCEAGTCGTAAVITPIKEVVDRELRVSYKFGDGDGAGPICTELYKRLVGIQYGELEDKFFWNTVLDI
ncbi:branched chain amino acid aminotransferase [Bacteroidia bacterium]|nr:branched chain amino acid aminotransferase [Bacteroidia bacterium]